MQLNINYNIYFLCQLFMQSFDAVMINHESELNYFTKSKQDQFDAISIRLNYFKKFGTIKNFFFNKFCKMTRNRFI